MAVTLNVRAQRAMTLDEYMQGLVSLVDPDDEASIMASAWRLHSLTLNGALLSSTLSRALEQDEPPFALYPTLADGCHAVMLASASRFTLRASIWPGAKGFASVQHHGARPGDNRPLVSARDHDCSFLTVGWFGPGCVFDIYACDTASANGDVGEKVPMRFLERTGLSEGKVMFFRQGKDVHAVHAPETVSVSLTLVVEPPEDSVREQFLFDPANGCISGYVPGSAVSRMVTALQLAGLLGHGRARDILCNAAAHSSSGRVRAAAYEGLIGIDGWLSSAAQEWRQAMAKDPSPHVTRLILTR